MKVNHKPSAKNRNKRNRGSINCEGVELWLWLGGGEEAGSTDLTDKLDELEGRVIEGQV